jgi:riboflavin synthase
MFSGIVQAVGRVVEFVTEGVEARLRIEAKSLDLTDLAVGDSIAVAGVCLTVVAVEGTSFAADLSAATLERTTLGQLRPGSRVNLEKSLRLADRLGGHLLSGHVDGVGRVAAIVADGRAQRWTFALPPSLARYVAEKGAIAVDGVSLTVNEVSATTFGVTLIPHTLAVTTFGERAVGDAVNLEVDWIARYVERLIEARRTG